MPNKTIASPEVDLFTPFTDTLGGWIVDPALTELQEESLIGFEIISGDIPENEGEVTLDQFFNDVKDNSSFGGEYPASIPIKFKGFYADEAAFEAEHTPEDGFAFYKIDGSDTSYLLGENTDVGKVYYGGTYYNIDYTNIQYGGTFAGEFSAGLFPKTTIKWKDIVTNVRNTKQGWPPPADDPMSRFLFSIKIDPTPEKTRSVVINYYVKTVTTIPGSTGLNPTPDTYINTFRADKYTYNKVIDNTLPDMIGAALETYFDGLPEMDYTTGEIIGE